MDKTQLIKYTAVRLLEDQCVDPSNFLTSTKWSTVVAYDKETCKYVVLDSNKIVQYLSMEELIDYYELGQDDQDLITHFT